MVEETDNRDRPGTLSNTDIAMLINRLNSLNNGAAAAARLAACGRRAIEPLRRFLLEGRPSGIYQPRQRAVEALAELGAKDVLVEYLTGKKDIPDPVERYGEEAVQNTAARLLARWRDDDVYRLLLGLLQGRATPGLIEAVGEFRRSEAIPEFIAALGDSIARTFAEDALRKTGQAAHRALLDAALSPHPSVDHETPSSLTRRRSALRLLAELEISAEDWRLLSPLADAPDPEIAARANRIALAVAVENGQELAARRLINMLPEASWFLQIEIESWLAKHSEISQIEISAEIARRRIAADGHGSIDDLLRRLLVLQKKIGRSHDHE